MKNFLRNLFKVAVFIAATWALACWLPSHYAGARAYENTSEVVKYFLWGYSLLVIAFSRPVLIRFANWTMELTEAFIAKVNTPQAREGAKKYADKFKSTASSAASATFAAVQNKPKGNSDGVTTQP